MCPPFYKPFQAPIKNEAPPADAGRFQGSVGNEFEELRLSDAGKARGIGYPNGKRAGHCS
ncbi:MAG: hypothetical protein NVS3B5_05270 [Sphingomicrobium sp.]